MPSPVSSFVERWLLAGRSERIDKHAFLRELCRVLDVPVPGSGSAEPSRAGYVLDHEIRISGSGGTARTESVDLYREGCFVFQLVHFRKDEPQTHHNVMEQACSRAIELARHIEPPPPFVILCDLVRCFELHACFDESGRYRPFPDSQSSQLAFADLSSYAEMLRAIWLDPHSLDRSRQASLAAQEAGDQLVLLAEDLRSSGHAPDAVAALLLRCLFLLSAEDLRLAPQRMLRGPLAAHWVAEPDVFPAGFGRLWRSLHSTFTRSTPVQSRARRELSGALPLTESHLRRLLLLSEHDWSRIDPAVLGWRLGEALGSPLFDGSHDWRSRRATIEELVQSVVEAPLRADLDAARAHGWICHARGDLDAAKDALRHFRSRLSRVSILDPACGTGAFLCVSLASLHQLDEEARAQLRALGADDERDEGVGFSQLHGIDVHDRSVDIARSTVWLAHLQRRARVSPRDAPPGFPLPWELTGIEQRDAILSWEAREPVLDGEGRPVTLRRNGAVGPEAASKVSLEQYVHPRKAEWPAADFVVGHPPFMGHRWMSASLGDAYVAALREAYPDVPPAEDLAVFWWRRAAALAGEGLVRRFGFILPVGMLSSSRVSRTDLIARGDEPAKLRIVFAVPSRQWGAVRVDVVAAGHEREALPSQALLVSPDLTQPSTVRYRRVSHIGPGLHAGPDLESVERLGSNAALCFRGTGNDARVFRHVSEGLRRYIATSQIAKHRVFVFLDRLILPDTTLACIALEDAHFLGVLSSRVHAVWASAAGASLAGASRYDGARCFEPFPFPACPEVRRQAIREIAEALDAHRWSTLAHRPELTLTRMYNLLVPPRSGGDKAVGAGPSRTTGPIAVLRHLHDELDRAVLDAYGWPHGLSEEDLLERVVALNRERVTEERSGWIRWLRPHTQPTSHVSKPAAPLPSDAGEQGALSAPEEGFTALVPWPTEPALQIAALRDLVARSRQACSATEIASAFDGATTSEVVEILAALSGVGVLSPSGSAEEPRWSIANGGWA